MMTKNVFERYEKKYLLTTAQESAFMNRLKDRLIPDEYGKYTVSNIYYDTDSYDLIRTSIEKPVYKEKLRLRSYGIPNAEDKVFLELKKKYKGVVYKRRLTLPYSDALHFLQGCSATPESQILKEIQYFVSLYPISEKVFICYDRTAYTGSEDRELRITFDKNIRFRQENIRLDDGAWGNELMLPEQTLLEIKIPGVFPIWLSTILSELEIFPVSFSKYGTCYKEFILKNLHTERRGLSA